MEYSISDYKKSDLVKLDILLNGETIDALSFIVHKSKSYQLGRGIAEKIKRFHSKTKFWNSYSSNNWF